MDNVVKLMVTRLAKYGITVLLALLVFITGTGQAEARVGSCTEIFKNTSQSNQIESTQKSRKSGIADFYPSLNIEPLQRDANTLSLALHLVDLKNTKIEGRGFFGKLQSILFSQSSRNLKVLSLPGDHTTKFHGLVEKGTEQTIQWQLPKTALKILYRRKLSVFSGLQLSMDFQGDLAKTSFVFYAKKIGVDNPVEIIKFVAPIPTALKTSLKSDEAPSYVIDFDKMKSEKYKNLTFSDFITDVELVGVGLSFNGREAQLKINGTIYDKMYFIADIPKAAAQFKQHLNNITDSQLVDKLIDDELQFLNTKKLHDIATVLANTLNPAYQIKLQDPLLLNADAKHEYHVFLFKLLLENKFHLLQIERKKLISFFEERPTIVFEPLTWVSPNGNIYANSNSSTKYDIVVDVAKRLNDPARQKKTTKLVKSEGINSVISYLENLGYIAKPLEFVEPHILWEVIAPYHKNTFGRFVIPTDVDAFGKDHGEYSHLLQMYTIVEGMNKEQLADFKSIFKLMQTEQYLFSNIWSLLFDASGSVSANSPRYWRDLMAD